MKHDTEKAKQFGSPNKQETNKMLHKHEKTLKTHAKKHGQVAMPHHPNYNKARAEKTKEMREAAKHMKKHGGYMKWINDSEFVIGNKVFHTTNPEWIKTLCKLQEEKNDNDPPENQEVADAP